jgi:hypothetical protein
MTEITTVGVLGAGVMGAGVAQVAAEAGIEVLLHDPLDGASDRALERIGVEAVEGVALEPELLGDGLDDRVGACQVAHRPCRADAPSSGIGLRLGELLLVGLALQETADPLERPVGGAIERVVEQDLDARLRRHLGDAGAHDAGPENADRRDLGHRPRNAGSRFSVKAATPSA